MEQMIIFVYDTGFCQTEADDPQKAVLYFHPHWVSDQQRLALCGQLMGAAHFCSTVFSTPRVLTLQCGKFILKKFGQYILSVGSDQTLPEWILQERFNNLELIFQFYHNSFDSIFNRVNCDQETFSKKLTEILEIYIPILQRVVFAFGNVFVLKCPKKNSATFLEAFQLLEACCSFKGVLGGAILYNSRVIATQLDPDLTKLLALTNKFHLRSFAEEIKPSFNVPDGVQLVKVYLKKDFYDSLQNAANFKRSVFNGVQSKFIQKSDKMVKKIKNFNKIFTVQEEEDDNVESLPKLNEFLLSFKSKKSKPKIENNILKERSKSFVGNLNIKICSTPTVEKTLIHEELVSICSAGKVEKKPKNASNFVPDIVQDAINSKFRSRILSTKYCQNRFFRISMDDLMIDFAHAAHPIPLKYYTFGLPKTYREVESSYIRDDKWGKKMRKKIFYKTIADPMNPVFLHDGTPVSKTLYKTYLDEHYRDFIVANITIDSREEFLRRKHLERENSKAKAKASSKIAESNPDENSSGSSGAKADGKENFPEVLPGMDKSELPRRNQKEFRRSLSLPLKPLFSDAAENAAQSSVVKNKVLLARTPTTPLTTKLSLLAFEEQQSEIRPPPTPSDNSHLRSIVSTESDERKQNETVASGLFVFGHQNMTISLILNETEAEKNPDLLPFLWEVSSEALKKVENLRSKTLANLSNVDNGNSSYSFLSLDNHWGALQRSGPWGEEELKIVGSLHHDLNESSNVTEMIIRNEESVVYGYSCGGKKVFYQQGGCSSAGLPTPADLMGMVTLKARRRLERDRDVVLL